MPVRAHPRTWTRIEDRGLSGHRLAMDLSRRINNNNGQRRERRSLFRPTCPSWPDPVLPARPSSLTALPPRPTTRSRRRAHWRPLVFIKRTGRTGPLRLATGDARGGPYTAWVVRLPGRPPIPVLEG